MLKAKSKTNQSKNKQAALRDVVKDDNMRGLFARIPSKLFKKLHLHLCENEQSYCDWLKKQINDI
jgi:hypothetical protein